MNHTQLMKKNLLLFCVLFFIISCKTGSNSDTNYPGINGTDEYKLSLNPATGSRYYYDITNESETKFEVEGKKVNNNSKTNVGVAYDITKDSSGNFLLNMIYDKMHLYTKSGDVETDMDADNSAFSMNPIEKMLGVLKNAKMTATVSPIGKIIFVTGYKELGDKIIEGFSNADINQKQIARSQWEQVIGEKLIKNNLDQLFKIFPDSAVHIGAKWKLNSKQGGDFSMNATTFYSLKAINSDITVIKSEGEIVSDSTANTLLGYNNVSTNLRGSQQGEYDMETKTGMLINCKITARVEGTIQVLGREIPVVIKTSVKMNGKKVK
jgi:hypothetical protein